MVARKMVYRLTASAMRFTHVVRLPSKGSGYMLRQRGWEGFTLIELMLVIAVITILAALLFPALKTSRDTAQTISCASNVKQLGLSGSSYSMDYSDIVIPQTSANTYWMGELSPYLGSSYVRVGENLKARNQRGLAMQQCLPAMQLR